MFVYQIRNLQTNDIYVGQTTNSLNQRFNQHITRLKKGKHSNPYLQNAWNKYGESNWIIEPLCECNCVEELNNKEIYYIDLLTEMGHMLYNLRGGGGNGGPHSEETKKKLSTRAKQQWIDDSDNLRSIRKTQWTDTDKQRMSETTKNLWINEDYRSHQNKIRSSDSYRINHQNGIHRAKDRIVEDVKRRWKDDEYKQKVSKSIKTALQSEEIRIKHLDALEKNRNNPVYQKKHRESVKKALSDPRVREKISKSNSKYFGLVRSPDDMVYEVFGLRKFCRDHKLDYTSFRRIKYKQNYSYKGWSYIHESNT